MNITTNREDIIYFSIIYFIAISLGCSFFALYHDYYLEGGPILGLFFFAANFTIPTIYFIRKGKVYAVIFATYALIILWLFYLIQLRGEMMIWHRWEGYWLDAWEFIFVLISVGIYYGFKIMIKQHLEYRNLSPNEKAIQKSFKHIVYRVIFFFICLFIPIIVSDIVFLLKIGNLIYDQYF